MTYHPITRSLLSSTQRYSNANNNFCCNYFFRRKLLLLVFIIFTFWSQETVAFSTPPLSNSKSSITSTETTATATATSGTVLYGASRDMDALQSWANENGILQENGFTLTAANPEGDDWTVSLSQSAKQATRVLQIPKHMLWSSRELKKQFPMTHLQKSIEFLEHYNCHYQIPQFYLALKLLQEYHKGTSSLWYPWIQSLPQNLTTTAISMDQVELDVLPPFAWSLATLEQKHIQYLIEAVQMIPNTNDDCTTTTTTTTNIFSTNSASNTNDGIDNNVVGNDDKKNRNVSSNVDDCILPDEIKHDTERIKWAFTIIFTRCWGPEEASSSSSSSSSSSADGTTDSGSHGRDDEDEHEADIVPMGDMFNHGYPANVLIHYDEAGNCNVILKEDIQVPTNNNDNSCNENNNNDDDDNNGNDKHKGSITPVPLTLSYGVPTNPSRFLTVFGFVDTNQPNIFCQILVENPTQRHVDMGYDVAKMVVSTTDGSIAEEIWDVVLYSILEQVPTIQEAFYQAHVNKKNDDTTKTKYALRQQFLLETGIMMKRHFDRTIHELNVLLDKIDRISGSDENVMTKHPRLPMIRLHNEFVRDTFVKVQGQINTIMQEEMKRRKQMEMTNSK